MELDSEGPGQGPRLYLDLKDWYPLLDLGSGGGQSAAHIKATLACTLVDLALRPAPGEGVT